MKSVKHKIDVIKNHPKLSFGFVRENQSVCTGIVRKLRQISLSYLMIKTKLIEAEVLPQ